MRIATGTRLLFLLAALALGGACGSTAESGRITARLGDQTWTVLLADRDGMRGRSDFDGADGMLFDVDQDVDPGSVAFTMDGVLMPLDIAWFTDAGALVGTASMGACPERPCPTYVAPGRFRWAIEAPPGAFDDVGPTDRLVVGRSGPVAS